MGGDAHLMPGFCQEMMVFWRVVRYDRAVGNMIGGDNFEH